MNTCLGPGRFGKPCQKPVWSAGLCRGHYQQRSRAPEAPLKPLQRRGEEPLETVSPRLHPLVLRELDRLQGRDGRTESLRLVASLWALDRIRQREGVAAFRAALAELGEMAREPAKSA